MEITYYINEIWKPIKGYEGLYEISTYGRIKSLNYLGKGIVKILNLTAKPNRYIKVGLRKEGKTKTCRVHRLMAETFLPPPQPGQTQIDHIDGNKHNNFINNIKYCSPLENVRNPNTMPNRAIRYHKEGEFERRSQGQKRRMKEHPEDLFKMWEGRKRSRMLSGTTSSFRIA